MTAAMSKSTQSLFESEMRQQVGAAEAAILDAMTSGDSLLVEAARGHLDGLIALARRNGLDLTPNVPADDEITLPRPEAAAS
jgi:hypothetical protein